MLEHIAFYPETFAAVQRYKPEDRCHLYEAMAEYAFNGTEPDWPGDDIKWFAWDIIKIKLVNPFVDEEIARAHKHKA